MKTKSLSRAFAVVLSAAFLATAIGCSQSLATKPAGQEAGMSAGKCGIKCAGKCSTLCKNADGSVKCSSDCRKLCCAKGKMTVATPASNTKCPISGRLVSADVTTVCCGQTVAFCCAGCIERWNKLPSAEKSKKLAAAK